MPSEYNFCGAPNYTDHSGGFTQGRNRRKPRALTDNGTPNLNIIKLISSFVKSFTYSIFLKLIINANITFRNNNFEIQKMIKSNLFKITE